MTTSGGLPGAIILVFLPVYHICSFDVKNVLLLVILLPKFNKIDG